ncbi:hypothetical protein ACFLT2_11760 [Acidobacteriota bacterium]
MKLKMAGVLILIGLACGCVTLQRSFAPKFTATGNHENAPNMTETDCLSCHRAGKDNAPIAPKSMLDRKNCIACHLKE